MNRPALHVAPATDPHQKVIPVGGVLPERSRNPVGVPVGSALCSDPKRCIVNPNR